MVLASSLVAVFAAFATSLSTAAGSSAVAAARTTPPVIVTVATASDLSPTLVQSVLDEAAAVWRDAGVTFVWQRNPAARLRVVIAHESRPREDRLLSLGWIGFDAGGEPAPEVHVSYNSAVTLLNESTGIVGRVENMPRVQLDTLLARAMGRALAHELGHYLSGSKQHAKKGLMTATHTAMELFGPDRGRFAISTADRDVIAARLGAEQQRVAAR